MIKVIIERPKKTTVDQYKRPQPIKKARKELSKVLSCLSKKVAPDE
jgi:hypothetical protein